MPTGFSCLGGTGLQKKKTDFKSGGFASELASAVEHLDAYDRDLTRMVQVWQTGRR